MNILMILERDFPPDLRVENEIKSLIKAGHSVALACYSHKKESSVFDWNGCTVYKKPISKFIYKSSVGALKFPFYFNFWRKHIKSILQKEKIDAVHIHDLPLAKIGFEIKQQYNVKLNLDLHENWPAYLSISKHTNTFTGKLLSSLKQWRKYELEYCNKADNVIVVVDEAKQRLVKSGINNNKITVVSNYPELSDFDNIDTNQNKNIKESDKIVLFYAGGINYHRGLQFVIKALPKVLEQYPNIEIRIFGKGNYTEELKNIVSGLRLEKNVIFFGQVPYAKVLQELAKAHITLIPHTKNEHTDSTIPHKLFQYILAGKPVLASNCLPIQRIVEETNTGAIYIWNDNNDASNKLTWLIENYNIFTPKRLIKTIKENYNWGKESEKLQDIYDG